MIAFPMASDARLILTINGGSSSIKFAIFHPADPPARILAGQIDRIGLTDTTLSASDSHGHSLTNQKLDAADHTQAADVLIDWLRGQGIGTDLSGIGHRVVHGGIYLDSHQLITQAVLDELKRAQPLDPPHLPREIALIEAFARRFPQVRQFACFDTAFHRDLPTAARLLPIPRRYLDAGVRRFGFHGLSCAYLMDELARLAGEEAGRGRIVLAHLGNGASITAVRGGHSFDTSMAFTPAAGLVMSTRCGDLDPGLLLYLMRQEGLTPEKADRFINSECGLLGVSAISSDMRDLLAQRATDAHAAEAIELFCYQARKFMGAYAAAMGGIDCIVFAGGIGEHAAPIRAQICDGLQFLGIHMDPKRNDQSNGIISIDQAPVTIRVIKTDEEIIIAKIVLNLTPNL